MDRRKFIFSSIFGSGALLSQTGIAAPLKPVLSNYGFDLTRNHLSEKDFKTLLSAAEKAGKTLCLPTNCQVSLTTPIYIKTSLDAQGSVINLKNSASLIIDEFAGQDLQIKNLKLIDHSSSNRTDQEVISIKNSKHVHLSNIHIQAFRSALHLNNSQHISLKRSSIKTSSSCAIKLDYNSHTVISSNSLHVTKGHLAASVPSDFIRIKKSYYLEISNNKMTSPKSLDAGLSFVDAPPSNESRIFNNKFNV